MHWCVTKGCNKLDKFDIASGTVEWGKNQLLSLYRGKLRWRLLPEEVFGRTLPGLFRYKLSIRWQGICTPIAHCCLFGCFVLFSIFPPAPQGCASNCTQLSAEEGPGRISYGSCSKRRRATNPRDHLGTHPACRGRGAATGGGSGAAGDCGGRQQGPRTPSRSPPRPCPARHGTLTAAFLSWLALGHGGKFGGGGGGAPRHVGGRDGAGRGGGTGTGGMGGDGRDAAPPRKAEGGGLLPREAAAGEMPEGAGGGLGEKRGDSGRCRVPLRGVPGAPPGEEREGDALAAGNC